jgi:hypothetical protein
MDFFYGGSEAHGNADSDGPHRRYEASVRFGGPRCSGGRRFKELTASGFTAAKRLDDGNSQLVKSFDPTAEETLSIPLQGGCCWQTFSGPAEQ